MEFTKHFTQIPESF